MGLYDLYFEEAKTDEEYEEIKKAVLGDFNDIVLDYKFLSHNLRATTERIEANTLICSQIFLHGTYEELATKIRYMLDRYNDSNFKEKKHVTATELRWRDNMENYMIFFLEMAEKDKGKDDFSKNDAYFYCRFFGYWEDFLVIAAAESSYLVETISHCSGEDKATVTLAR